MQPTQVLNTNGKRVGAYLRTVDTPDGQMLLIAREERLGGGAIVVPACEASEAAGGAWRLPYDELSIRESPQYSPNVDLHAYYAYWKRLGAGNYNSATSEYMPTGSGQASSDLDVPDDRLLEAVLAALRAAADRGVDYHLVRASVRRGTVLLEGYQNDTLGRLAAAAASVPGVNEIVNMLVVRAL
jgi:hypothetical protein